MKSMKCLLISLLLLCAVKEGQACWVEWYTPKEYNMYRIYDSESRPYLDLKEFYSVNKKNCEYWQQQTSRSIPLGDIYHVVSSVNYK